MRHSTSDNSVRLDIPDDWDIWDGGDDDLFVAAAPEEDENEIQPQLLVTRESNAASDSESYMVGNVAFLQSGVADYVGHGSGSFSCDGYDVAWHEFTSSQTGFTLTAISYFIVFGDSAYQFQFKAHPDLFGRWRSPFEEIVRTLSFT
ncbi:hypothetical protein [Neorhodopirellula lusitana]|uniref:hypothetical protein n=1 Tax=Neorhodopirellula lusitana TaxID=445327 RepID=UPI00384C508E